jgi:hypothetical protein
MEKNEICICACERFMGETNEAARREDKNLEGGWR